MTCANAPMLSVTLPPSNRLAVAKMARLFFWKSRGRVVALRGVGHLRVAGHGHGRDRHRALADRVAGHLEQAAVGRQFGELAAGMAGDAVLSGLAVERRDRPCAVPGSSVRQSAETASTARSRCAVALLPATIVCIECSVERILTPSDAPAGRATLTRINIAMCHDSDGGAAPVRDRRHRLAPHHSQLEPDHRPQLADGFGPISVRLAYQAT